MKNNLTKIIKLALLGSLLIGCGSSDSSISSLTKPKSSSKTSGKFDAKTSVKPTSFKLKYKDKDHIILSWDKVEKASSYTVKIAVNALTLMYTIPYKVVYEPRVNLAGFKNKEWWVSVKADSSNLGGAVTSVTMTQDGAYISKDKATK